MTFPDKVKGVITDGPAQTHWQCACVEAHQEAEGREYRDYTLERRLAPLKDITTEAVDLLPQTKPIGRQAADDGAFKAALRSESRGVLLLRCLLRESGQDIKDGLERPIGTRWVHYAVPRAIYDVPRPKPRPRSRRQECVNLVRYALNTATVGRPVLPPVTDTLLVADRFRSAVMALCPEPSSNLSGHEADGMPCGGSAHARWWPVDEDNDGFIDHVMVWAPGGFEIGDVDALRRLTRIRQRGGRPDLLVTPTFVGTDSGYSLWRQGPSGDNQCGCTTTFVSATPYFCPVHLSHGRGKSGKERPVVPELLKSLKVQGIISEDAEVQAVREIVFDYAPHELAANVAAADSGRVTEPVPPRQYFPVIAKPVTYAPLPRFDQDAPQQFRGACVKDPDAGYSFGLSIGLCVDNGSRFIRAMSFCRRRRHSRVKGCGRLFTVRFRDQRPPRPFAIGDQCHFGLGLFIPVPDRGPQGLPPCT